MGYIESIFNNTRYIVFIQTKYHQNLLPEYDVSSSSLKMLLETIGSYRGGHFRSIKIYKEDITSLIIYERNFINYKKNVLSKSIFWNTFYNKINKFKFLTFILDLILYNFVFLKKINKFGKTITNSKPKYLINVSEQALDIMYSRKIEYSLNKEGKEIIKHYNFNDGNLIINEEVLEISNNKSKYFLQLLIKYFEKKNIDFITKEDFIKLYDVEYGKTITGFSSLILNDTNIRNSYIHTINEKILEKYDRKLFELKKGKIQIIKKI